METHKAKMESRCMKHKKKKKVTEQITMENQQFTKVDRNRKKKKQ